MSGQDEIAALKDIIAAKDRVTERTLRELEGHWQTMRNRIAALEAENARLQGYERLMMLGNPQVRMAEMEAENARMRAVVEAVADETGYVRRQCFLCDARTIGWENGMVHTADCPVTIARAILASDGNGGTTTNEPEGKA